MTDNEKCELKWRLWNAIDEFLSECDDVANVDQLFERYEEVRESIWCPTGDHDMTPDQCGIPEHDYCRLCGKRRDQL